MCICMYVYVSFMKGCRGYVLCRLLRVRVVYAYVIIMCDQSKRM